MTRFLVDTDLFIDHFRAASRIPVTPQDAAYSSITRAELYAGKSADEGAIDALLGLFEEIGVTREIAEHGGRIKRTLGIPLADSLLAATAMTRGLVLATRNIRHFDRISGLRVDRR